MGEGLREGWRVGKSRVAEMERQSFSSDLAEEEGKETGAASTGALDSGTTLGGRSGEV
jgi:hypothetical protein